MLVLLGLLAAGIARRILVVGYVEWLGRRSVFKVVAGFGGVAEMVRS